MSGFEQQPHYEERPEGARSFDVLAPIDQIRFDLQTIGDIAPETKERVCDEQLSYLAEGIERASRTSFTLQRGAEGQLLWFDRSEWRPYMGTLISGLEVNSLEAQADPRRNFLADWAAKDLRRGYAMQAMQPGQSMAWASRFPHAERQRYGDAFLEECGLQPKRQLGFLYRAECQVDGSIVLESQTIDRSDDEAFDAALAATSYDADADLDTLVRTYDGVMVQKYGGRFYAGRRGAEIEENIWQTMLAQRDLIDYLLQRIEALARSDNTRAALKTSMEQLMVGVWKTFKKRLDGSWSANDDQLLARHMEQGGLAIEQEVAANYQEAVNDNDRLVGCGGSIKAGGNDGSDGREDGSLGQLFNSIFGSKGGAESYTFSKKMFCVVCQAPPKEQAKKKQCGPCGICRLCDAKLQRSGKE